MMRLLLMFLFLIVARIGHGPTLLLDLLGMPFGDGTGNESSFIAAGCYSFLFGSVMIGFTVASFFLWGSTVGFIALAGLLFSALLGLVLERA